MKSLAWAADQLRRCDQTHTKCSSKGGSELPRRVLDIGQSSRDIVRLYETEREPGRYACLSYCWGRRPFLRTVTANFDAHLAEIPWDQLPLTHQETIAVVRQLGIRYLWIDSLCIIQDDKSDWRCEAGGMASIYKHSCLVISASKSSAANDGLFSAVSPDTGPYKLAVSPDDRQSGGIYTRIRFTHVGQTLHRPAESAPPLPVFARGWTLQERFLAPRILHFNRDEIAWECLEDSACQCSGIDSAAQPLSTNRAVTRALKKYESDGIGSSLEPKWRHNPLDWRGMSQQELQQSWHDLIEDHSRLELTYESDIFPATSGLAKELQRVRESKYLAGLWENSLLEDLCWHVASWRPARITSGRPTQWRAPTWSWASVTGSVRFTTSAGLLDPCQVLESICTPASTDPTGELTSGHLVLKGLLIPTDLLYKPEVGALTAATWQTFDLGLLRGMMGSQYADYNCSMEGEGQVTSGSTVYCFLLGRMRPTGSLCLLVLRQVGEGSEVNFPVYERIGFAELFFQQFPKALVMDEIRSYGQDTVIKVV